MIYKSKKAQITIINLFGFLITIFVYAAIAPTMNDAILPVVSYFEANPSPTSPAIIILLHLLSFVVLLSIIMSTLSMAIPRREGQ